MAVRDLVSRQDLFGKRYHGVATAFCSFLPLCVFLPHGSSSSRGAGGLMTGKGHRIPRERPRTLSLASASRLFLKSSFLACIVRPFLAWERFVSELHPFPLDGGTPLPSFAVPGVTRFGYFHSKDCMTGLIRALSFLASGILSGFCFHHSGHQGGRALLHIVFSLDWKFAP